MTDITPHLFSLDLPALRALLKQHGIPAFRAQQLWDWVFTKGVLSPAEMTNLSKKDQALLTELIDFTPLSVVREEIAKDGTVKWLFGLHDGHEIEAVFIPERTRGTLCVSSQVGCTLNCRFCHTGTQGLSRNLAAHEIIGQLWLANKRLGTWSDTPFDLAIHLERNGMTDSHAYLLPKDHQIRSDEIFSSDRSAQHSKGVGKKVTDRRRVISNVVYMGMGEPLFNWDNVKVANERMMDANAFALGSRRITISTSGMVPNIGKIADTLGVNLAISIHAADNETRSKIMPINNKWPIEDLMAELRAFPLKEKRRITWEYVMLDGVNDSTAHAERLVKLIKSIPSFVNIIPFNEWPGSPFKCSPEKQIYKFKETIKKAGVDVQIRRSRGNDILAACGQLRGETSTFNTVSTQFPSVVMQYGSDKQKLKVTIAETTPLS